MLEQLAKQYESKLKTFDPTDVVDLKHYYKLRYEGKQGDRRYILEQPFPDVVIMMMHKIAERYIKENIRETTANTYNYG